MTDNSHLIGRRSRVTMHYSLGIKDGPQADSTFDDQPLTFEMGDGTLVEGLEMALLGLEAGEEREVTLEPEQAFGYKDTGNIHTMARSDFPDDLQPEPGLVIDFSTPDGDSIPGMILEVTDDEVQVDFNHPLAGHEVEFKVKVLEVENPAPEAGS